MPEIGLHGYWRSSASYRVRIALNIKGLEYRDSPVNLLKQEEKTDSYLDLNPMGLVPALAIDGQVLHQSLAICEYLDEQYPDPPLLPMDRGERARVRATAQVIACEIHPLNNLRVLKYLGEQLGRDEDTKRAWYSHWVWEGFRGVERILERHPGSDPYCFGGCVTLADVCLVPQVYNAERYECDLTPFPRIREIVANCNKLEVFDKARPENQIDAR